MDRDAVTTRAHDLVEALTGVFPQMQFQGYIPHEAEAPLYLFGFIAREVLTGGYAVPEEASENDFTMHFLSLSQFFRKAVQGAGARFYPEALRSLYETHQVTGILWRQVG